MTDAEHDLHWSDCAVNNGPALPAGPCNCGGYTMTPEELDEARAKEADRLWGTAESRVGELSALQVAARLAREGWTPPEPVDPDLLAFREWEVGSSQNHAYREEVLAGKWDKSGPAYGFLAGARMAREQERERAKGLVEFVGNRRLCGCQPQAQALLAKYRGEA